MRGTTFKRCNCRDPHTRRPLGQAGPDLRRPGGAWSARHGVWHYQIELPARADGTRRPLRRGGYDSQTVAEAELDRIRAAFAVADPTDNAQLTLIGDLVEDAVKTGGALPSAAHVRKALFLGSQPNQLPTVAEWLESWLHGRKLKAGTIRSY
ncbi:MAG: hypothetical protein QOE61_1115, partial [Micromonosporaceae bacterium]|nr:hypothetical protein [Micromonosporaceae bacterium]